MTILTATASYGSALESAVDVRDSTQSTHIYQFDRDQVPEDSPYEMTEPLLMLLARELDGDRWVSWEGEHATGTTELDAAQALWTQLTAYLESLIADEADLSPALASELERLRAVIRRR